MGVSIRSGLHGALPSSGCHFEVSQHLSNAGNFGAFSMSMILSEDSNTSFEQPPSGTHVARCVAMIDLGTQRGEYLGEPTIKRQVVVRWELPSELMTSGDFAGKPFTVSKFYNASLNEKSTLRKDLAAWRGRDFTKEELRALDIFTVIGKCCMLNVGLSEKGKAKVTGVMGLPKGMQVPPQVNESFTFSLSDYNPMQFESLPKGFKKMVEASPEYQAIINRSKAPPLAPAPAAAQPGSGFDDLDDDIPFITGSAYFDITTSKQRRMVRR